MEEHEGDHVQKRRGDRRGERAYGSGQPDPPDRRNIPEYEGEERPAENFTPRAAGRVVRIADPEQRHQSEQEGESRSSEPSRREQEGRAKYRSEFAPHRSH